VPPGETERHHAGGAEGGSSQQTGSSQREHRSFGSSRVLKNPGQGERTHDEMAPASTRATARAPTKWMPAGLAHDDKVRRPHNLP
jgi:hypothetical protein